MKIIKYMVLVRENKVMGRDVASFGLGGAMASPNFFFKNIIYIYICVCVLILAILLYKITFFSLKQYN